MRKKSKTKFYRFSIKSSKKYQKTKLVRINQSGLNKKQVSQYTPLL